MHDFTPWRALAGGALIGIAASVLWLGAGRVAGVSGIVEGLFSRRGDDRVWRLLFLVGLGAGGLILAVLSPSVFGGSTRSLPLLAGAGLLVGFGSRLGGGCTSGHGICGLSRLSRRSLAATVTFIATGMLTVLVSRALGVTP
jgi:uncharacterized membrane protein YedE/YeeE